MGLDMFFYGRRYLWDFDGPDQKVASELGKCFPEIRGAHINRVEAEFKYWRKANAIHKWFVDNSRTVLTNVKNPTWISKSCIS
jgi:5S rRNA maturation endonuclease (ribonuclease M5)